MEPTITFIFLTTLFLAYANGANDNFKGVATLYGSKTLDYKKALAWTTFTTALGCGLAMFLAGELIIVFKGKGLVPDDVILMQNFPLAVGAGAVLRQAAGGEAAAERGGRGAVYDQRERGGELPGGAGL